MIPKSPVTPDSPDRPQTSDEAIVFPSPCLVVLVGPAGVGKSTWSGRNFPGRTVSSDVLRGLLGEGTDDQRASADAFAVLHDIVARRLRRRLTTVIDSLGSNAADRAAWRSMAQAASMPCIAVIFEVVPAVIRARNSTRPAVARIPVSVLTHQLERWPDLVAEVTAEPFSEIVTVNADRAATTSPLAPTRRVRRPTPATSAGSISTGRRPLRFGLQIPRFEWPGGPAELGARLREIAVTAERAGFDSLWVMDHFFQIPMMGRPWENMLDSWTTIGHLAAATSSIRLGTMVTGITYRHLAHLAKIVATADVLSGGRIICGLGTAWYRQEHEALGWAFPSAAERYALLEDALQLLPLMWGPGTPSFEGRTTTVSEAMCYPRPLQQHLPILIGGSGERRTLALVARYGDACNLFGEADKIAHKLSVLHAHCADVGRDPAAIEVTQLGTVLVADDHTHLVDLVDRLRPARVGAERFARSVNAGTVDEHVARAQRLYAAGVDTVVVSLADLAGPEQVERFGQVIAGTKLV